MIITTEAAAEFKNILDKTPGSFIRITIDGGGCAGFSYSFSTDIMNDGDILVDQLVLIDPPSSTFLENSTVTLVNNLTGKFFKIEIPEAKSVCGCGTSFSI